MESTKQCTRCGRTLPLLAYGKHRHCKDGLNPECKECNNKRSREFGKTPSGAYTLIKGRQKYHKSNNPSKYKPVLISRADFIDWYTNESRVCVYCGLKEEELDKIKDQFLKGYRRLTVDCKDNKLGYVAGNLVLCCRRCNTLKIDFFTYEQMLEIGERFVKPHWEKYLNPRTTINVK